MLGLVLGGGGAKGYAHIGIIKILEELNIRPSVIVGASMGSLVGGFYAAGITASRMEELAIGIDKKMKRWLFPLRLSRKGFINGKHVTLYLSRYIGGKRIEELPVKYAAIATDVENLTEMIIDRGDLVQAIRSSISIPVAFVPARHAGRVLIDGGFPNPVPITAAQKLGASKIIAINVMPRIKYGQESISNQNATGRSYGIKKVFDITFTLITSRLIDHETTRLKEGIMIDVDTNGIGISQFEKAREAIERGYREADRHKEQLMMFAEKDKKSE